MEILQNTFFMVWYIMGDLIKIYCASLVLGGIILSLIYQMVKR